LVQQAVCAPQQNTDLKGVLSGPELNTPSLPPRFCGLPHEANRHRWGTGSGVVASDPIQPQELDVLYAVHCVTEQEIRSD
jgi:hypothetical protein